MRGAGCTLNDIADRDFDGRVARTANRPIPSGDVSVRQAFAFLILLCLIGLLILLQFNAFAVGVGAASLVLVAVYPFTKRVTHWPQAVLGLTFNWGALLGWAAVRGDIGLPALADDSGLVVEALGNAPGVYSARYAGENATDEQLCEKLLKEMDGKDNRKASFACVISIAVPTGPALTYEARCDGLIAEKSSGQNGF